MLLFNQEGEKPSSKVSIKMVDALTNYFSTIPTERKMDISNKMKMLKVNM
jgi:hypothetical protein